MRLNDYARRLLALAETVHRWLTSLSALDPGCRDRIANYAGEVAATLDRAATALQRIDAAPCDPAAQLQALREFGRISGYIETIVSVLQHHLDGRKLAGVKRRLETLRPGDLVLDVGQDAGRKKLLGQLVTAEGYFRALADGLRA